MIVPLSLLSEWCSRYLRNSQFFSKERYSTYSNYSTSWCFSCCCCCCCCVGPRKRVYCSMQAYWTYPMCVQCSHFHRQEAPRHNDAGDPSSEMCNLLGEKRPGIWSKVASSILHASNLRHGTDGFTSPPKEVVLRIFSPWKIRRLRPGLNPVLKASTQPLDHRSRLVLY
jgi:hypothetical protein